MQIRPTPTQDKLPRRAPSSSRPSSARGPGPVPSGARSHRSLDEGYGAAGQADADSAHRYNTRSHNHRP